MKIRSSIHIVIAFVVMLGIAGCATLDVTPSQVYHQPPRKLPVTIGVQASGERLVDALKDPDRAFLASLSDSTFNRAMLLPSEARFLPPREIATKHGTDYVLTLDLADISAGGSLNPLWFISIPMVFFKSYAPIVTFHVDVTISCILRDCKTDAVVWKHTVSRTATDHFSPKDPHDRMATLFSKAINNALVTVIEDLQARLSAS